MKREEMLSVIVAVLILFVVAGLKFVFVGEALSLTQVFIFSFVIIFVHVFSKKWMAYALDSSVEHRIWHVYRTGFRPSQHFKRELPFGLIVPLVLAAVSTGVLKVMTLLTYETRALRHRAAKRHGAYSYTEMTDWHNGLIGAAGILALLVLSFVAYFPGFEYLSKMAAYYAFWNMLPISKLDGTQIFFGNRVLWTVLGVITLIFALYALVL